jgi:Spy/CpxP family protein refolding chaperone
MRAMVGAGVLAATTVLPLATAAHATPGSPARAEDSAGVAAQWQQRGPFPTFAICEQRRDTMAGLGYPTRRCYYVPGNPVGKYYYDIYV